MGQSSMSLGLVCVYSSFIGQWLWSLLTYNITIVLVVLLTITAANSRRVSTQILEPLKYDKIRSVFNDGNTDKKVHTAFTLYQSNVQCGLQHKTTTTTTLIYMHRVHMHAHKHIHVHTRTRTHTHTHVNAHTYTHTHAHTYTHASSFTRARLYNYKRVSFKCRFRGIDQ